MKATLIAACAVATATAAAAPTDVTSTRITYYVKHQPSKVQTLLDSFHKVSNPEHVSYGNHLSLKEVQQLQTPLQSDVDAVLAHIQRIDGTVISSTHVMDKIVAQVPVAGVQAELTSLWKNCDLVSGLPRTKASLARVASEKKARAKRIAAAQQKSSQTQAGNVASGPQSCLADRAVPPCIRKAYGIVDEVNTKGNTNAQAVVVNQGYKMADLKAFCSEYNLKDCPSSITNVGKYVNEAGDEATLDVQYSTATGQGGELFCRLCCRLLCRLSCRLFCRMLCHLFCCW